ncbi:MAG: SurA N-terminal domain-containing protein [Lachnospiraceae bacterium]|nr:SurA N-terminal domain-containing protein [Lachnospiraceae bacterium]
MRRRIMAAGLVVMLWLTGCGQKTESVSLERETQAEQSAFIVNGEDISYREWNFYVRMNQMQWEKSYLESYGDEMWSREVNEEGLTLAERLKDEVFESIVETHLINQYAGEYEVAISEEEETQLQERAQSFMRAYHEALLRYAGADEEFVYEKLSEVRLSELVEEALVENFDPQLTEDDYHREGICYVLISTTGLRDAEGVLEPFSEEEVARRTQVAQELCVKARESGDLKASAREYDLTPVESSMGKTNTGDGQEHRMLDAARKLAVGEISDPIETEEGWFLVQHTSDYDEEGVAYWKEYLTSLAKQEECRRLCKEWREEAEITVNQEIMDQVDVKIVLKELL